MKLLIEEHKYAASDVTSNGKLIFPFEATDNGSLSYSQVGYFFNAEINDCVFLLPKVILDDKGKVFSQNVTPEDIVDLDKALKDGKVTPEEYNFLYGFSVWIFRAIAEYRRLNENNTITRQEAISAVDQTHHKVDGTWLELMLAILKCCEDNKAFFMFTIKNIYSGHNRINWRKTISSQQAWLAEESPIYIDLVNRKKQINFDEELLIIFFSIVKYICNTYGFKATINCNYELITGSIFQLYLNHFGKTRLQQIKYKYFTDKALKIWNLCYDFFDRASQINSSTVRQEYLFATSFHHVFETMVDELIGDKNLPYGLQVQKDGKILDHLYRYHALVNPTEDIYHIADSKYYRTGAATQGESRYKQFTYAKNVIQYNLNILLYGKPTIKDYALPYRDKMTEGYNITPNFFISAQIDKGNQDYSDPILRPVHEEDSSRFSSQFKNRLFDRDTLWLSHFSINFLFVLSLYAAANDSAKETFRNATRARFRKAIIALLNNKYTFYDLPFESKEEMQKFVDANFRQFAGKLFHFTDVEKKDKLYLALETNPIDQESKDENARARYLLAELLDNNIEKFKISLV